MSDEILITGGKGYLGGRIALGLLQDDLNCFVRLGSRVESQKPHWLQRGDMVVTDFESKKSLDEACAGVKVVVHLAALNHLDCSKDPEQAFHVNVLGTLRLLQAAQRAGVDKFIYVSTAHVYGSPLEGYISEQSIPHPMHPYALTHKAAEDCVLAVNGHEHLQGMVMRLSNGFGFPTDPHANCWSLLVNDLCRQAAVHQSLQLKSSGLQRRDFVTLQDVQRAVFYMMHMEKNNVEYPVFNVGGKWSPRIIDVAMLIQERCVIVLGYKPELIVPQKTANEVNHSLEYSIDKLLETGFCLKGVVNDEIDQLLVLCAQEFGAQSL